jgi:hypothetical protein
MMLEAQEIAEKLGVKFPIDVDRRIDGGAAVGAHRTSMLQDLDAGRPMEIDALVGSVQELGRITDTPTPTIDTVLALGRNPAIAGHPAGHRAAGARPADEPGRQAQQPFQAQLRDRLPAGGVRRARTRR